VPVPRHFSRPGAAYDTGMYEHFEHTADLGLRVRAADLDTLFAEAAEALLAVVVEDLSTVEPREGTTIRVSGTDLAYLLFDWLRELLFYCEVDHRVFRSFEVHVSADGLVGTAWGEPYNPGKHPLSHEVKAITYHGLRVEPTDDGGWLAEVIVDI
jgi:SHS2 domain-containing protein